MRGLAMCVKGSINDKLRFCFSMFDLDGNGFIDRTELQTCLESTAFASFSLLKTVAANAAEGDAASASAAAADRERAEQKDQMREQIEDMVEQCFEACDKNNDNQLSIEEFKRWMFTTPQIVQILYSVFELRAHAEVEAIAQEFAIAGQFIDEVEAGDERLAAAMQARRKSNEKVGVLLAENASLRKELRVLRQEFARLKARRAELGGKSLAFLRKK